jgi:hypothetical protein
MLVWPWQLTRPVGLGYFALGTGRSRRPPLFGGNLRCRGSAIVAQHCSGTRSSAIGTEQHGLGLNGEGGEEIPAFGTLPLDHAGWRLPALIARALACSSSMPSPLTVLWLRSGLSAGIWWCHAVSRPYTTTPRRGKASGSARLLTLSAGVADSRPVVCRLRMQVAAPFPPLLGSCARILQTDR